MEEVLDGNLQTSDSKIMDMLVLYGTPANFDWVSTDTPTEGLTALLTTLWQETHIIMAKLLSLVRHSPWERRAHADWAAEDELIPIHVLCLLLLYFNTCFISIEDKDREIYLCIMMEIRFDLYSHTFDVPHMPDTFV